MSFVRETVLAEEPLDLGVDWEEVDCLLCGGNNWQPFTEAPDRLAHPPGADRAGLWFLIVRCRDCGLCFTNPRPSANAIQQFYPSEYAPHHVTGTPKRARWWQRWPLVRNRMDYLRRFLPTRGKARLLDFGCGGGEFLLRMRQLGWQATGLDPSEATVEQLRAELGLHVLSGSLPHPAFEDNSFEAITMWQSLEHVHHPLETLRCAHKLLVSGGQLIVTTPNIDSLAFRWFGDAWNGLDLPRHLVHFNRRTLRLMLYRAGFRSVRCYTVRRSGWLRDSALLMRRRAPQARWPRWLQSRSLSNLVSWYAYYTGQADCLLATATKK